MRRMAASSGGSSGGGGGGGAQGEPPSNPLDNTYDDLNILKGDLADSTAGFLFKLLCLSFLGGAIIKCVGGLWEEGWRLTISSCCVLAAAPRGDLQVL